MKNTRLHLLLLSLFALGALTANAAQLASAKVMSITGNVMHVSADGTEKPLQQGEILQEGDTVVTPKLSSAALVFSNGSELTVQSGSSLTIAELTQTPFGGSKSYEQLNADPSTSQAALDLDYGKVSGHVKKLANGSSFEIRTAIGTAAIRGTTFVVDVGYDAIRGEYVLKIKNEDGIVDVITLGDPASFGKGTVGEIGFNSGAEETTVSELPPAHTVIVRYSENDPLYDSIINRLVNYAPLTAGGVTPPTLIFDPTYTPDLDPDGSGDPTVPTSPSGPAS